MPAAQALIAVSSSHVDANSAKELKQDVAYVCSVNTVLSTTTWKIQLSAEGSGERADALADLSAALPGGCLKTCREGKLM